MPAIDHNELLSEIRAMAAEDSASDCQVGSAHIYIPAPHAGGVDVRVSAERDLCRLAFDRLSIEVHDPDAVKTYVRNALDGELRVRVDLIGGVAWKWSLEVMGETGHWREIHAEALINWRFWAKTETQYLCNASTGRALRELSHRSEAWTAPRKSAMPAA